MVDLVGLFILTSKYLYIYLSFAVRQSDRRTIALRYRTA